MKRVGLICLLAYLTVYGWSQKQISQYEYWFDNSYSSKKTTNITFSASYVLSASIPTLDLPTGLHTFQLRFKDDAGVWSTPSAQFFVKPPVTSGIQPTITNSEYWFDTNTANKISQAVTANNSISLVSTISTGSLPTGLHTFQVRFKDSNGVWSTPVAQFFVKPPVTSGIQPTITNYEYWFDTNTANKISQVVTANNSISLVSSINTGNLPIGLHTFQVRFKDSNGMWSTPVTQFFVKPAIISFGANQINQYRYWFDTGFDKRTTINVDPVNPLELKKTTIPITIVPKRTFNDYTIKIDSLNGNKIVYHPFKLFNIQFKDIKNNWSGTSIDTVRSDYEVDLKCDTLVSKVAKNITMPTSDTLHIYKTAALAGDSLYFNFRPMFPMKYKLDIFDPNGNKIKSLNNYFITTGLRTTMDGLYYVVVHGLANSFGYYTLNYTHIDKFLPDLHVSSVTAQDAVANTNTTISWTVKNDGTASTASTGWVDRIWLVKDLTKDFSTIGVLLKELQNSKSLDIGESYQNSVDITIPERSEGNCYVVVMSDMRDVYSINWTPTANVVPAIYTPNMSGSPYPYLNATTNATYNKLLELNEKMNVCDNFFFKRITITSPPLPDLQVGTIQLPTQLIADRKATVSASIANNGTVDIVGKSWIDRIYISKDGVFNKTNATLLATSRHSGGLKKDSTYVTTFQFTAPADTLNLNRFFVETDALDSVFESNQDNNITSSTSIQLQPNTIIDADYQILKSFYNAASGVDWTTKWKITSNRINSSNWYGVSFEEGNVKSISLPSNKIKGDFPIVLFTLPKLKQLNLSDNQLTEKIDSTLANLVILESIKTDSLASLNLGKNHLTGEIPSMVSVFPRLQSLNLENNMLSTIRIPLPKHITNLNIQNQAITVDSVKLSVTPELVLPTICTYNHSSQSFDYHPYFSLLSNGNYIGNINYSGNNYHLYWNNPLGWTYESGQPLVLRQETGLSAGSTSMFKLLFKAGDANVDQQVDILDVQHSLNYLLGDNPQPFNFSAANTYKDTLITVQDIVKTVNIILSSVTDSTTAATIQKSKVANASPNHLYIANNNLVLDAVESVSAMDVTLNGISDKQLRLMLSNSSFQLIARTFPEGGTRFIIFSPTGNEIKAGKTIIAGLYNENVGISSAKLSDKSAKLVSVSLSNNVTTGLENSSDLDFSVYTIFNRAVVTLPSAVEKLYASLYTTQGVMIDDRTIFDLPSGKYIIDYSSSALNTGVYILKLSVKSQGKVLTGNAKLIISK